MSKLLDGQVKSVQMILQVVLFIQLLNVQAISKTSNADINQTVFKLCMGSEIELY